MKLNKFICGFILFSTLSPTIGHALKVTNVAGPNLTRPSDNNFYPFTISVSGIYDLSDTGAFANANLTRSLKVSYYDEDFPFNFFDILGIDDPIDLDKTLTVPIDGTALIGTPWGPYSVEFRVGCTSSGKVFGPSGPTGEGPMVDGLFEFTGASNPDSNKYWGYNFVGCSGTLPSPPTPVNPYTPVPGPLPIFGAYATYAWTRKLRKRIQFSFSRSFM